MIRRYRGHRARGEAQRHARRLERARQVAEHAEDLERRAVVLARQVDHTGAHRRRPALHDGRGALRARGPRARDQVLHPVRIEQAVSREQPLDRPLARHDDRLCVSTCVLHLEHHRAPRRVELLDHDVAHALEPNRGLRVAQAWIEGALEERHVVVVQRPYLPLHQRAYSPLRHLRSLVVGVEADADGDRGVRVARGPAARGRQHHAQAQAALRCHQITAFQYQRVPILRVPSARGRRRSRHIRSPCLPRCRRASDVPPKASPCPGR